MTRYTRRQWMAGLSVWPKNLRTSSRRTNIVLVMADDQGWGDTGYNGHPVLQTPYLDAMARSGMRFDRFYSGAPVCSPTRGSCLTGRHPFRYGVFFANAGRKGEPSQYALPQEEITIAEVLKPLGYRTGHFGKWHLGDFDGSKRSSPFESGFSEWFSTVRKVPTADPPSDEYWENGKPVTERLRGDDCKIIMDRALSFIARSAQSKEPFLAVVWMHTPHLPVVTTPEYRERYRTYKESQQHYWGAITAMDEQIGRLRSELRRLGVAGNTMVWYASDNGPEGDQEDSNWPGTARPFRGRKTSLFEGGIRVPGLLEWPDVVRRPGVMTGIASTSDYFPTIIDALGLPAPHERPLDGISLLPALREGRIRPTRSLAFETTGITRGSPRLALIEHRYKLLTDLDGSEDLLWDLLNDPYETKNLAPQFPEEVRRMRGILAVWRESCRQSNSGADYRPLK